MNPMLSMAIATAYVVASIFFLRFWKSTGDRFFMFFTFSFLIEGVNRVVFYPAVGAIEQVPIYYMIRLVSYGLILIAILDKNRSRTPRANK